mgnify:CR=1 FL=1
MVDLWTVPDVDLTAARMLGWTPKEAIGKEIEWNKWGEEGEGPDPVKEGRVIGVVKDFHFRAHHQTIEPLVLHIFPAAFGNISIRIRPENVPAALDHLESVWQTWASDWPFLRAPVRMDFGPLLAQLEELVPDHATRRQILWDTPCREFGFPG